jgi:hypothetical protein
MDLDAHGGFTERYGACFEAYRRGYHWFGFLDLLVGLLTGVLGGVMPIDGGTCRTLLYCMAALNVGWLIALMVTRPYNSLLEALPPGVNNVMGVVWAVLVLIPGREEAAATLAVAQMWMGVICVLIATIVMLRVRRVLLRIRGVLQAAAMTDKQSCDLAKHGGELPHPYDGTGMHSASLDENQRTPHHATVQRRMRWHVVQNNPQVAQRRAELCEALMLLTSRHSPLHPAANPHALIPMPTGTSVPPDDALEMLVELICGF